MKKKLKTLIVKNGVDQESIIEDVIVLFKKIDKISLDNKLTKKYSLNYNFIIYKIFEIMNEYNTGKATVVFNDVLTNGKVEGTEVVVRIPEIYVFSNE